MKTYSEARIELRNLQFLKKMLEKSSQSWSLDQPNKPKSLDVALNIAGVEKYARKTCDCGQPGGHSIRVLNGKERKWRWKFVSSVVGDSQISLKLYRRHLLAAIQLAVSCCELYFTRCCAVKRTGTFAPESKVMCLFYLILRSGVLMFRISNIDQCVKNFLRLRRVEFIK